MCAWHPNRKTAKSNSIDDFAFHPIDSWEKRKNRQWRWLVVERQRHPHVDKHHFPISNCCNSSDSRCILRITSLSSSLSLEVHTTTPKLYAVCQHDVELIAVKCALNWNGSLTMTTHHRPTWICKREPQCVDETLRRQPTTMEETWLSYFAIVNWKHTSRLLPRFTTAAAAAAVPSSHPLLLV